MGNSIISLVKHAACFECGACVIACPKSAILLQTDRYGFKYPKVDEEKCVGCQRCINVCPVINKPQFNITQKVYAAASKDESIILQSTSGGVFSAIALDFIRKGGIVWGAAIDYQSLDVYHIAVDNESLLPQIQGSKYVKSSAYNSFIVIKDQLNKGKKVLFSGTPCQVSALYSFLGEPNDRLYTIDIICHGVPENSLFKEYFELLSEKNNAKITDIRFRDKSQGWALQGHITYHNTDRECRFVRKLSPQNSSYYHLFLDSEIYRECCYSCPYAGTNRVGDITIGDFWGIQDSYPEYLVQYGGKLSVEKGISCLLVNTAHGEQLTIDSGKNLFTVPVTIDSVIKHNKQLTSPSSKGKNRNVVLFLYSIGGYRMIEHWYIVTQTIKKTILKCYRRMVSALRIARS